MRCDLCCKRNVDTTPAYIYGETFMLCEDCYEEEAERGFIDDK